MPAKRHVVILIDVNSIPSNSSLESDPLENNDNSFESKENGHASNISYNTEVVVWIKEKILSMLCKEAAEVAPGQVFQKFDFSRVMWSFKIYNSSFELNSTTGKKFLPLDIESFELFEKQLDSYLEPSCPSAVKSLPKINNSAFISTAIKSVLGDLSWPPPRDRNKFDSDVAGAENRNVIHAFFRVPRNDKELTDFMPSWTTTSGSKDLLKHILSKGFIDMMRTEQIQLNFMDVWPLHDGKGLGPDVEWDGLTYSRPILRIVHFLSQGMVTGFSRVNEKIERGYPSYATLLKIVLGSATSRSKEEMKTFDDIKKIALKSNNTNDINGNTKISPSDTEAGSSRSLFSTHRENNSGGSLPTANRKSQSRLALLTKEDRLRTATTDRIDRTCKRYSDERESVRRSFVMDSRHELTSRKRKVDYDEERFQMGYQNERMHEIQNWCTNNNRGQRTLPNGYSSSSQWDQVERRSQKMRRSTGTVDVDRRDRNQRRYHEELSVADYSYSEFSDQEYPPPSVSRQSRVLKRVRMDDEGDKIMAPPGRSAHKHHQTRQSAPAALTYKQNIITNGGMHGRGKLMLEECLKQLPQRKPKEIERDEFDEESFARLSKARYLEKKAKDLKTIQTRFTLLLKEPRSFEEIKSNDPVQYLKTRVCLIKDMVIAEEDKCLASAAQVFVSMLVTKLRDFEVQDVRDALDAMLIIPFNELNVLVIRSMNTASEEPAFRECHLQVLLKLELFWAVGGSSTDETEESVTEDIMKILHLIQAYRKEPPIGDFVNDVLINEYSCTHKKLLLEISHAIKIKPSPLLNEATADSPVPDRRDFIDDCSISSANSSTFGLEDSCSQHPRDGDNSYHHNSYTNNSGRNDHNQSHDSQGTFLRSQSYLSMNNPKRALMIPSKVRTQPATGSGKPSPKPKRVRRNLFDVSAKDPKDMKHLISLIPTSPAFARSPSLFKSPISKKSSYSPRSPARLLTSPFFRAARSRRRLVLDENVDCLPGVSPACEKQNVSPGMLLDGVICPESPATPKSYRKVAQPGSHHSSLGTSGKSVIQESPEIRKSGYSSRPLNRRVDSVSFYSSGADSLKSRCWEKSKAKIVAARIKDSVDMRSASLTLNDLEFLDGSPNSKTGREGSYGERKPEESGDDIVPPTPSPEPCTSKALQIYNGLAHFEVVRATSCDVNSSNIEALISSEILPSPSAILNRSMNSGDSLSDNNPLDTPSKRVQFNLQDNLVNTPSPARYAPIFGTPKSILKELSTSSVERAEPQPS